MSDSPPDQQANPRRRRRGGRNRGPQSQGGSSGRPSMGPTPRSRAPAQTGFQKFLSAITFGLLGKPAAVKRPPFSPSARPAAPGKPTGAGRPEASRPPREPKPRREFAPVSPTDINTDRLYVGNLSYDATESDLFELFNGVGTVRNAEVVVNNRTQRSKGFAFVTMATVEEARRAVETLNGKEFMGRGLQLSGAKPIGSGEDRGADSAADS